MSEANRNKYLETSFIKAMHGHRKGKVNTLAQYMATYDDLYCHEIYQLFAIRDKANNKLVLE